jgi:hypothetical protein
MHSVRLIVAARLGLRAGLVALCLALVTGCGREEVRVYRVPKEQPAMPADAAHAHGLAGNRPRFTWQAPADWKEQDSGGVRIVRFVVKGEDGQSADVGVVPLTGASVPRAELVNMVRAQVGLGPATEAELTQQAEKAPVGPLEGDLFELVSTNKVIEEKHRLRILMASVTNDDTIWLFKMSGTDDLVRTQRTAFLDFLKSVRFEPAGSSARTVAPATAAAAPSPNAAGGKPKWQVPAGWQEQTPGPMVVARFAMSGQDGKAELTVSVFPGDTGGLLANVNRWRGQVGLAPVDAAELPKLTEALDVPAGKVTLVDMTGTDRKTSQPARLIGAILPRGGQTWFFKLLGDAPQAGREKAALIKFIQSTQFPDA